MNYFCAGFSGSFQTFFAKWKRNSNSYQAVEVNFGKILESSKPYLLIVFHTSLFRDAKVWEN